MNAALAWDNLVAYSLQVGLVVGLAAFVPAIFGLRQPKARLIYWHLLLIACLALPLMRPWQQETIVVPFAAPTALMPVTPMRPVPHNTIPRTEIALLLFATGAALRLVWLIVGFWKLRRYRAHSRPLEGEIVWRVNADLRISDDIASPVTFGYLRPVILLPCQFETLDQAKQDAILCHEVLHVWRHDWLFTLGEELIRALFWFHPAIWWLLGEIQLAREQAVDREVIALTSRRDEYLDALLAIAGAPAHLDLAPAPLFLRKRHLKQRVVSILLEVRMSKTRLISAFALSMAMLAAACWFAATAFPLNAAPQTVGDAIGVSVDTAGAPLMHRNPVRYPQAAVVARIEGTVVMQVKIGAKGDVTDASVLSGPDELRKSVITSVLDWHFTRDSANSTREIRVTFELPKTTAVTQSVTVTTEAQTAGTASGTRTGVLGGIIGSVPSGTAPTAMSLSGAAPSPVFATPRVAAIPGTLKTIRISGLSDSVRADLLSRLPVHEGDNLTSDAFTKVTQTVKEFDEHLNVTALSVGNGESSIQIMAPNSNSTGVTMFSTIAPPGAITVAGSVQQAKLVRQPYPVYPTLAKQAHITGVVHLNAVIGKDGTVGQLGVISGHPLLAPAAMEAVRQWVYQPTLLNGQPVEVFTQIDVTFTLVE